MRRWLRWLVPFAIIILGFTVTAAGFFYDVMFAGLPYQDPTPEMQARWRYHQNIAMNIVVVGQVLSFLGMLSFAFAVIVTLVQKRRGMNAR